MLKSDPNRHRKEISRILKEIDALDRTLTRDYKWVGHQLEEKKSAGPVRRFFRRIGGLFWGQTMRFYADEYRATRKGKPDELELEGNLSEQIFRFNMQRRDILEGTKRREEDYDQRMVIANHPGTMDVRSWFQTRYTRMGTMRSTVKGIDIVDGDRRDMGEIAKDIILGAEARGDYDPDADYFAYRSGAASVPVSFEGQKGAKDIERVLSTRAQSAGRIGGGATTGIYTGESSALTKYFKRKSSKTAVTAPVIEGDVVTGASELADKVANPVITPTTGDMGRWSM